MASTHLIDTHSHLFMCKPSIDTLIDNAQKNGVQHFVNVAVNLETAKEVLDTARAYTMTFPTIGIHPLYPEHFDEIAAIETLYHEHSTEFVAIGEMGLDYKYPCDKANQQALFRRQLDLARTSKKPAIIHNRESDDDMATILSEYEDVKKVLHCFSSEASFAKKIMSDSQYFSFTGVATYAQAQAIRDAIKVIPLSKLMIETDCPYLTPAVYGKAPNEPAYVVEVAKTIAEVKGLSYETVCKETTQTAIDFFGLSV